ncbi:Splicing factor 3b subunit [Thalictrum thalictroides]|uniref:Splicing factor 3b subunit n=1 Tax=Thalictrum thalictroides TaxID=46969 RepID=A0A7J6X468_THATH|nr:Splicing factor 3b subunit [Thalictrum thalictroides]
MPEMNVQNGILKSLSFLFEYIGEMGKDYIYTVIPLLEDALMDRDLWQLVFSFLDGFDVLCKIQFLAFTLLPLPSLYFVSCKVAHDEPFVRFTDMSVCS